MTYTLTEATFPSLNSDFTCAYYIYKPVGEIKGILQISHGMCEYITRYERLADFFTDKGFIVCGHDHIGHGNSINSRHDLGYFGANGLDNLVGDLNKMYKIIGIEYPKLPHFILGHSMGSFILRAYLAMYQPKLNAAIISGTAGKNPAEGIGRKVIKIIIREYGEKHRSPFLKKLFFGAYNKKTAKRTDSDWLSLNEADIDKYIADPKCNYNFTANGYLTLLEVLSFVTNDKWYAKVDSNLPILLIGGELDPVSNYSKGIHETEKGLQKAGTKDLETIIYTGLRHEVYNEIDNSKALNDTLAFIEKHI